MTTRLLFLGGLPGAGKSTLSKVLARDIPSLREVWQEGALYFPNAASLSALLGVLEANPDLLDAAQYRSFARARCFSAERMVASYKAQFANVLDEAEAKIYAP